LRGAELRTVDLGEKVTSFDQIPFEPCDVADQALQTRAHRCDVSRVEADRTGDLDDGRQR
jgi:hypothetical protein